MAAYSNKFPWPSHYGHFSFFEERMQNHSAVKSLENLGNGLYKLHRKRGDILKVFVCECYAFGVAEYIESEQKLGKLDAVVINSAWCGFSRDARKHCWDANVGLFRIGDFMAALNQKKVSKHLNSDEKEYFTKKGWI